MDTNALKLTNSFDLLFIAMINALAGMAALR